MSRASLRREHPHAGPERIDRLLREWLATRPGAEHGDAIGVPRTWSPWVSGLESAVGALLGRLARHEARVAVVGGLAVSARTEPRFTRDVDLCVAVDDDVEAESLVRTLQADGYRVLALVEQEVAARIATVRLAPPRETDPGVVLDLLFASSGIEPEVIGSADDLELFEGFGHPIATVSSLIALKVLSRDDARVRRTGWTWPHSSGSPQPRQRLGDPTVEAHPGPRLRSWTRACLAPGRPDGRAALTT